MIYGMVLQAQYQIVQVSVRSAFLIEGYSAAAAAAAAATAAATAAKLLQSCPTLCDPMDCSPPGSPIPGILQARVLEWGAIAFSGYSAGWVQVRN